jgi:hypothetical protein
MDPNSWPDLLFTYGPYAVLALFALWVAPRQTKRFLDCKETVSRYVCGGVAVGCWVVVALMVWFIYQNWPPRTVYTGSLGTHGEETKFITADQDFFISTQLISGGRLKWNFAIVSETPRFDPEKCYAFSLIHKDTHQDYEIMAELLKAGSLRFHPDPNDPSFLLYDHDRNPQTPYERYPTIAASRSESPLTLGWTSAAFAQDDRHRELIQALSSNNEYFQAQARRQLRDLSDPELQNLLQRDDLPFQARRQIEAELQRRN